MRDPEHDDSAEIPSSQLGDGAGPWSGSPVREPDHALPVSAR